ncbi:MAG TPA: protein kinase [Candidatus Obscuribacterales bacterium]
MSRDHERQAEDLTLRIHGGRTSTPVVEPPSGSPIGLGDIIDSRYEVVSFLGEGGMATVYKIKRLFFQDFGALKIAKHKISQRTGQRFRKEAIAARDLDHPNLLRVYDFGLLSGDLPYFVMDYIRGETLAQKIKKDGMLSQEDAATILDQVCYALAYAHTKGVIHRDIKPSNIMLVSEPDGKISAKVVDFGIAKLLTEQETQGLTQTGEIFGSPLYMSPEQCLGHPVDHRSDLYSFGCTLFEALTGVPPFQSDSALTTMLKHQTEPPPSLKEVTLGKEFPQPLESLVARLLAKNPDDRPQSFSEARLLLQKAMQGEDVGLQMSKAQIEKRKVNFTHLLITLSVLLAIAIIATVMSTPMIMPTKDIRAESSPSVDSLPAREAKRRTSSFESGMIPVAEGLRRYSRIEISPNGNRYRVFRFPGNANLGILYPYSEDTNSRHVKTAKGEVYFDANLELGLRVLGDGLSNSALLRGFQPEDLCGLSLPKAFVEDSIMADIIHLNRLKQIDLSSSHITDFSLALIDQKFKQLEKLDVSSTQVTAEGLASMRRLKDLVLLRAGGILENGKIVPVLRKSKRLRYLSMHNSGLTDEDLRSLSNIKTLSVLFISRHRKITDKGIGYLVALKNLTKLDVALCHVTPRSILHFERMPHLRQLTLSLDGWSDADKMRLNEVAKRAGFELRVKGGFQAFD